MWRPGTRPFICALSFFLLGLALIPYAGIQNDEALFAGPLYRPFFDRYGIRFLHHGVPLMVFPYTVTQIVSDSNCRPVFELYRFHR